MPANSSAARNVVAHPATVADLLDQLMSDKLIGDKTFAFATVELELRRSISPGVSVMLKMALHERLQHGTGGTPVDDALLIINTVRGDWVGGKP